MRFLTLLVISMALCQISTAKPTCAPSAVGQQSINSSGGPRPLRIVLYPLIPGFASFKGTVKSQFEAFHPDIQLEIIDLSDNYYGPFAAQYIGCADADVYELDSVFLYDFAVNKKIQELPPAAALPDDALLKNAVSGSMANGKRYGAPHWVCGNFLFFNSSDAKLRGVKQLTELVNAIGQTPAANQGLAVDLMGKSTLGEFYLNAAFDRYGDLEQARQHIAVYDPTIKDECLKDNDFDVEEFPLDDKGTHAMSWVDSFVLDKKCKDQCAKDAVAFIQFMTQDDIYLVALLPKGGRPTYLLPAKASLYSNAELLRAAHLYPKLRKIIEQAAVPSALSLNEQLRNVGRQLDSDLPQQ